MLKERGGCPAKGRVAIVLKVRDGVHGVASYRAQLQAGLDCDTYLLEGDPVEITRTLRVAAPYPADVDVVLDAAFAAIVPFDYSFAEQIRDSSLPQTID